ncbi:SusC/RagA family TonB-linked outer membrane protein [Sphingobacterium sp. BIGb0165]|uniref:SusC/RagA family TonB-linked outer membrane protein n=1 Tax=Sphingobacterium sp. BIGb0165 TaxID=2940615 RepID=UPI002168202C|nr:SusC/RagA family TonB-linked outer membrane protein [Sphingobacterium sp. BIGb0165]MCS4224653.1 TonB-linked SusC/RagA family outer membrane protein [Sphingobacterium sp. BIGb0165]
MMKKRMSLLFLLGAMNGYCFDLWAQEIKLNTDKSSLKEVLHRIEQQTNLSFLYSSSTIEAAKPVSIRVDGKKIEEVLPMIFKNQPISYTIKDGIISLKLKSNLRQSGEIQIEIRDEITNYVIEGATMKLSNGDSFKSSANGSIEFSLPKGVKSLTISSLGYGTKTVILNENQTKYVVKLTTQTNQLSEVIVNSGIINRKKDSFTGATATISGEELKRVGNMNILESIKSLDPSIVMPENINMGANPNALPQIELRGQSSISLNNVRDRFASDPNQPLIILNGFQTTLQKLVDLDMNRVASISILKDAASTAIYGAQAANGVIVIETIRPKGGQVRVSYTADTRVQLYDLQSYNLMNAAEKLDFEKKSGRFTSSFKDYNPTKDNLLLLDSLYNERLKNVSAGVNTYWLDKPLQTGFTHKHSLYIDGGSDIFQYGVGVNYQNIKGIMKGSDRKNWGSNIDLTYRNNKVNISNQLFISGSVGQESPYGSFTQYAQLNPYWKYDWTGDNIPKYIEVSALDYNNRDYNRISNPFFNASLNSYDKSKDLNIINNLALNYDILPELRFTTSFQLGKSVINGTKFVSPLNTQFDNTTLYEKGSYVDSRQESQNYQVNGMFTYNKVFNEKHVLTANARAEVFHSFQTYYGTELVGFPTGVKGLPSFAYQQRPNTKAGYDEATVRRANMLLSANYVYDNRYLFDATYRIDGSTAFGSDKKYSPFWSVGAGINLHNEAFLKGANWLNLLRLRANIGYTGNQNFGSFQSTTVYAYDGSSNIFGQGDYIVQLGNPALAWQKTMQTSLGIDFGAFDKRLSLTLNGYIKNTDPLIISLNLPTSTGTQKYPENLGILKTKGLEFIANYAVLQNKERDMNWTFGLQSNIYQARYDQFGAATTNINNYLNQQNSLQRYMDGNSPYDIWAVKSLGINPANGQEVFQKKDGNATYDYDFKDVVKSGSTRPISEGVLSSQFRLGGLSMGMYLRYKIGGSIFNTALYNKVENISQQQLDLNQDRRALNDRWQQPGDLALFKSIAIQNYTPMSSRFIQKENVLSGESFSLGYEFRRQKYLWMSHCGLQTLRFTAYANDIFRVSTVNTERGLDYPFARNISFTVNATF